jgi:uncharacterized lipoprotein YddW (UPF0748 family)
LAPVSYAFRSLRSSPLYVVVASQLLAGLWLGQSAAFGQGVTASPLRIPKREVRAAWIVTVKNTNWPKSFDTEEQKRSLISIFESMKRANLNTIILQVRARGDLLYPSQCEPWAQSLTGTLGQAPAYDPLQFAVAEAHKLGMEIHAWWNVVKVADGAERPPLTSPQHIASARRDWVKPWRTRDRNGRPVGTEWWLDMGLPDVRSYLISVVMELVRNYDIDGIHFDYLRYPGIEFDDEKTYAQYGNRVPKDEWRRENINAFVRAVYDSIIAVKPMLKVGSTPIGIYRNLPGAEGWQGYTELFQDARRWLSEGKQDYLLPQIYWGLSGTPKFNVLARDWQGSAQGRHVYIGVGAYKPNVLSEIPALIDSTREVGALGNCFFTYDDISRGDVFGDRYLFPALIPPMPWKDSIPPNAPKNLSAVEEAAGSYRLQWSVPSPAADGDEARVFAIYRFAGGKTEIDDPANLVALVPGNRSSYRDEIPKPSSIQYRYVVTSIDKGNLESQASNETTVMVAELVALARPFEPQPLLTQNFPNPFSNVTFIGYELREKGKVELKVVDAAGKDVVVLVDTIQDRGQYIVTLGGEGRRPGVYRCVLSVDGFRAEKSMEITR